MMMGCHVRMVWARTWARKKFSNQTGTGLASATHARRALASYSSKSTWHSSHHLRSTSDGMCRVPFSIFVTVVRCMFIAAPNSS